MPSGYALRICNAYAKYICICVVYTECRRIMKVTTKNIRFDENDLKILAALKSRLPGKTETEIMLTSLKMYAVEVGAMTA